MERLGELHVEIRYKKGIDNAAADALSRLPQYHDNTSSGAVCAVHNTSVASVRSVLE